MKKEKTSQEISKSGKCWGLEYRSADLVSEVPAPYDYDVFSFYVDFGDGNEMEYNEALDYVTDVLTPENDEFSEEAIDALLEIDDENAFITWVQEHVCTDAKLNAYEIVRHQYEGNLFSSREDASSFIEDNAELLNPDTYPVLIK